MFYSVRFCLAPTIATLTLLLAEKLSPGRRPLMLLSFDVGTKNLVYCLLDEQESIHKWSLLDVRGATLVDQVMAKLKEVPMAETVLIEQ